MIQPKIKMDYFSKKQKKKLVILDLYHCKKLNKTPTPPNMHQTSQEDRNSRERVDDERLKKN
jgi:hypothetical protein